MSHYNYDGLWYDDQMSHCNYCGASIRMGELFNHLQSCWHFSQSRSSIDFPNYSAPPALPPLSIDEALSIVKKLEALGWSVSIQPALAHNDRKGYYITLLEPVKK